MFLDILDFLGKMVRFRFLNKIPAGQNCFNVKINDRYEFLKVTYFLLSQFRNFNFESFGPLYVAYPATTWGGGGVGSEHPRFFLNNIRVDTGINANLGIPLCISLLRRYAKFLTILSKNDLYRFK